MTTPKTESGRALLAKEDYAMPEDIIAIEQEAASAAVANIAGPVNWLIENYRKAFVEMPTHHYNALVCAALIAESRGMPQCDYSETGPQIEGAPFAPSTWHCVLRLGHAGPHEFRDVAL